MCYSLDVVYHETAWECESALYEDYEKQGGGPRQKSLFDSAALFLLPITSTAELGRVSLSTEYKTETVTMEPVRMGKTTSVVYRSFAGLHNRTNPSVGVQALNFYGNGQPSHADQKQYSANGLKPGPQNRQNAISI